MTSAEEHTSADCCGRSDRRCEALRTWLGRDKNRERAKHVPNQCVTLNPCEMMKLWLEVEASARAGPCRVSQAHDTWWAIVLRESRPQVTGGSVSSNGVEA